jgi:hypothetical protein
MLKGCRFAETVHVGATAPFGAACLLRIFQFHSSCRMNKRFFCYDRNCTLKLSALLAVCSRAVVAGQSAIIEGETQHDVTGLNNQALHAYFIQKSYAKIHH